jgi:hypothetical protein
MTLGLALGAACGAALAVHLGWPREPLRRLAAEPVVTWPGWLRAKESAMPVRTRGIASAGAAVTVLVAVSGPLPACLLLALATGAFVFWVLVRVETRGAATVRATL